MEKLSVEELEELIEKEFDERAERAERIQNTISLFRIISGNPRQFNYRDVSVWFFKSIKILPATF